MKSPFGNSAKMQLLIGGFLLVLILAFATRCHADEGYLQMSAGAAVLRGAAPALDLSLNWPDAGPRDAAIQVATTLVGASTFRGWNRNQMAVQALVVDGFRAFDVGVGLTWLQNEDAYNSSPINYSLMLAYRLPRITVLFRHWSNAGTRGGNLGRDLLFIGWRF